jgi:4'-phosphopantetheinyl transferase EntD
MIESLFPSDVGVAESTRDLPDAFLFPEEAEFIAGATTERLTEFRTGRWCARRALAQLGYPELPILCASCREPVWPTGSVGSITHCDGYRAAVAARSSQFAGIGIDAEPNAPLLDDVLEMISTEREYQWVADADESPICRGRLLFSAKESLFKAWYPATREWLDFKDVEVFVERDQQSFLAMLTGEASCRLQGRSLPDLHEFVGRFQFSDRLILTAVTLSRPLVPYPLVEGRCSQVVC